MELAHRIINFLSNNSSTILFSGAGVSARSGLPVWSNYLKELAELARPYDPLTRQIMVERIAEGNLINAATYYFICNKIPKAEKYKNLAVPLDSYNPELIRVLTDLPFQSYITTNYDKVLHDAYAMSRMKSCDEVNLNDPTLKAAPFKTTPYIARIHGRVEVPESMVLSEIHYQHLETNDAYTDFLAHIFTKCQIMFIGFSFSDPAISSVFENLRKKVGTVHNGKHIALIPSDAESALESKLYEFNIETIKYSPKNNHDELWSALNKALSPIDDDTSSTITSKQSDPFALAKKYISSCFARAKLGNKIVPLREAVVEGLVSQQLKYATENYGRIKLISLVKCVSRELSIVDSLAEEIVYRACRTLENDGLCRRSGGDTYEWTGANDENAYELSVKLLVEGVISRFVVREGGSDIPETRECVNAILKSMIISRGWDLGAAFAANSIPVDVDIDEHVNSNTECSIDAVKSVRNKISRSVRDLITNPNTHESDALVSLGRASFALELVLQTPHDSLFHGLVLPEKIYLDANVLMPAITEGHPYHEVYTTTIRNLIAAALRARIDVKIIVLKEFLNEVISHKRIAQQEAEFLDNYELQDLKKEALLGGPLNMNVFLGAFVNLAINDPDYTDFTTFLRTYAPYESEQQLTSWLKKKGISVINEQEAIGRNTTMPDLLHLLESAYAQGDKYQRKDAILIRHDAVQLAALLNDAMNGKRSVFVSADRRLRNIVSRSKFSSLGNSMISHIGLSQLIDLLVGNPTNNIGLSRMMWLGKMTDASEQVRNYFVNAALSEYEAAYAMEMNEILDTITEDVLIEASAQHIMIPPVTAQQRQRFNKILGTFEDKFFSIMKKIIQDKKAD